MTTRLKRKRTEDWLEDMYTNVAVDLVTSLNKQVGKRIHEVDFPTLFEVIREQQTNPACLTLPFNEQTLDRIESVGPDTIAMVLDIGELLLTGITNEKRAKKQNK